MFSLILIALLLLSLLLSIFALYIVLKNILSLKKIYKKPNDALDSRIIVYKKVVNDILFHDLKKLRDTTISNCRNSVFMKDPYPEASKLRRIAKGRGALFDDYIKYNIEPLFDNTLMYDDALRMFARNYSAYVGCSRTGKIFVERSDSMNYAYHIFSIQEWGYLYYSAKYISILMKIFVQTSPTDETMPRVCNEINRHFDKLEKAATTEAIVIEDNLKELSWNRDAEIIGSGTFGLVLCIFAILIFAVFLIILLCTFFMLRKTMIKPLIFIFVALTLLFILIGIITFFYFVYGVIEYNEMCRGKENHTISDNFANKILKNCKGDENIYTFLDRGDPRFAENSTITTNCTNVCVKKLFEVIPEHKNQALRLPYNKYCYFRPVSRGWLKNIELSREEFKGMAGYLEDKVRMDNSLAAGITNRFNGTSCMINLANKLLAYQPLPPDRKDYMRCNRGHKTASDFIKELEEAYARINDNCKDAYRFCELFEEQDLVKINGDINEFKRRIEEKLFTDLGTCNDVIPSLTVKEKEFCECETYILNGIWVGCLFFLISLLIPLFLLPCLIYLLKICEDQDLWSRRDAHGKEGSTESVRSILLPPIGLPRDVIDSIEASPNPRITYMRKKMN
ncbi:uncharacterized protein LOC101452927 isoform X3 [Ceratitis capitata]|nr:uncharacterized protein LOC101452927 isoform X3 [Ceratitis capitata]